MKINLGCGTDHMPGWLNVDKFPASNPDRVVDLEQIPWPLEDNCADEILLKHVLEHLGKDTDTFLGIMGELYRICKPGALVKIWVPHPRHTDFLADPTHVRPVLPDLFYHFSYDINVDWQGRGLPGTPLAMYLGLDFQIEVANLHLDPHWLGELQSGRLKGEDLDFAIRTHNNVVQQVEVGLRAIKPFRGKRPEAAKAAAPIRRQPEPLPPAGLSVVWEGTFFRNHSLSKINREVARRLMAEPSTELSLLPYEPDDFNPRADALWSPLAQRQLHPLTRPAQVHVRHQWPPKWEAPPSGAWVLMQPWEFGCIPQAWLEPLKQVDEVWVPSTYVRDGYVQSGVDPDKVVVIPNGVDTEVFTPAGKAYPLNTSKACRFLFVGGTIGRKGIDILLTAWKRAFTAADDVALVIKGNPSGSVYAGSELDSALAELRGDPQVAPIEYLPLDLDESQLASLYRACQAFVLPYRGEGFGMPIAEAMACGLPVIVTAKGASRDFCDAANALLLPSETRRFREVDGLPSAGLSFQLEEPSEEALVEALRQMAGDAGLRARLGAAGRARIGASYTWDHMAARIRERMLNLARRQPRLAAAPVHPEVPLDRKTMTFVHRVTDLEGPWLDLVVAYVSTFRPGEPVLLLLDRANGPSEGAIQDVLAQVLTAAGQVEFPDVAIISSPQELGEFAASSETLRWLEDASTALPQAEALSLAMRLQSFGA